MKKPIKVAITGKIGSGKTTVCIFLKKQGFQIFESDKEVRKLLNKKNVINKVSQLFSVKIEHLFDEKNRLNREVLGNFLFSNKIELKKLEDILYPLLETEKKKFLEKNSKKKLLFFDIPLLFEKKLHKNFDKIIYLKVNKEIQKQRVLERVGMNKNKLKQILFSQRYNLSYFNKYISLRIDTSEKKNITNERLRSFIQTL